MSKQKVLVAISGGVDSAFTAHLLNEQGFDVTCIHFLFWRGEKGGTQINTQEIAKYLKLPIIIADKQDEFFVQVVEKFLLEELKKGNTPNPCVFCNKHFKFKHLLEYAKNEQFDFVVTGHYAQSVDGRLFRGTDASKDQSFFLYRLSSSELKRIKFPLGEFTKSEVKAQAQKIGLDQFVQKNESQDLCFIKGEFSDFIKKYLPKKYFQPGDIVYEKTNKPIGKHDGIINFTIGQRAKLGGQKTPLFVCKRNFDENIVYVTEDENLYQNKIALQNCAWINNLPEKSKDYFIQIRHQAKPEPARFTNVTKGTASAEFTSPVRAITKGQSAVVYDGEEVIGGGIVN